MSKLFTATVTVNYADDEKTYGLAPMTLGEIAAHAEDTIKAETTAISFLISIVPVDAK